MSIYYASSNPHYADTRTYPSLPLNEEASRLSKNLKGYLQQQASPYSGDGYLVTIPVTELRKTIQVLDQFSRNDKRGYYGGGNLYSHMY